MRSGCRTTRFLRDRGGIPQRRRSPGRCGRAAPALHNPKVREQAIRRRGTCLGEPDDGSCAAVEAVLTTESRRMHEHVPVIEPQVSGTCGSRDDYGTGDS